MGMAIIINFQEYMKILKKKGKSKQHKEAKNIPSGLGKIVYFSKKGDLGQ